MGLVCCLQGNRCVDEAGIVVAAVRSGNAATLGADLLARPPRGSRGVGERIAKCVKLSLLCADDTTHKGGPGLVLLGVQHLEDLKGRPCTVEILVSHRLLLVFG